MPTARDPRQKAGYELRRSIVLAVRDAVQDGAAESQNAFAERALIRELQELHALDAEWDVTSADGLGGSD